MKLTYLYNSGFCLEIENITLIIDFYKDPSGIVKNKILPNKRRIYVLCTHNHADHFSHEIFEWNKLNDEITYILSKEIKDSINKTNLNIFYVEKSEYYEDEHIFVKAYGSTDIGSSFFIKVQDLQIFHAGDLNNWHWNEESTMVEIEEAERNFKLELEDIKREIHVLDVALFPIDPRLGQDFMKGVTQFITAIKVKFLVPMHFQQDYTSILKFREIAKDYQVGYWAISYEGESINI